MKHSLKSTGLSMSQAQSISNLCNQRAQEIDNLLKGINNATKKVKIDGETYDETVGKPIPGNVVDLLKEKAALHACQAFLMENIKAKDKLLNDLRNMPFSENIEFPVAPQYEKFNLINPVDEIWGANQLTLTEVCEYIEAEAYAAHIGQFIHKNGLLTKLREELPTIKTLQFMSVEEGKKIPIKVVAHHSPEQLILLHEELAMLHREYEQKVNYFKAKIKNLVSIRNTEISKLNAIELGRVNDINQILRNEWNNLVIAHQEQVSKLRQKFEENRQKEINKTSQLRISVDARFQTIIDKFMSSTKEEGLI